MKRSQAEFYYQGQQVTNQEWPALQHNGLTYIPIRLLESANVGIVGYDAKTKIINLDPWVPFTSQDSSVIYDNNDNDVLEIRINSSSDTYKAGEPLNIWATLRVKGEQDIQIRYGGSLISYYLMDQEGSHFTAPEGSRLNESLLRPDDEMLAQWSDNLVYTYNVWANQIEEVEYPMIAAANTPRILRLPAGTYTIGVAAEYQIANEDQTFPPPSDMEKLEAKIQITIE